MAEHRPEDHLSCDEFLGGKLRILQPQNGYRAGVDPVLLAASIPAVAGDTVLELGCGVGVASLCLGCRVPGLTLTGLEIQGEYADLARKNADANGLEMQVFTGDLMDMPDKLRQTQFTHVIANPPYFDRNSSVKAQNMGREIALGERTALADWIKMAAKRAAPKGYVSVIQRAERLPEMLATASRYLGSIEVMPLIPRSGRAARLVLMRGRKGGRADFRLHHGWMLHEGETHQGDRENYTTATTCILRHGSALPFPT